MCMAAIILFIFVIGYLAIAFEEYLKISKTALALLTGVVLWSVYIMLHTTASGVVDELYHHLGQIAGILFFLLGAMTIVEIIDAHDGFSIITDQIHTNNPKKLLWILCIITFFLSSVLDNLTTAIVMVSVIRKLIDDKKIRLYFVAMVVIAANSGGAWSPIGDVTTTMLWIGGQLSTKNLITTVFVPGIISMLVPLLIVSRMLSGNVILKSDLGINVKSQIRASERKLVLFLGFAVLLFVPVFKSITGLPPFMGVLFGVGILWAITELLHKGKDDKEKDLYSVVNAIRKTDTPSVLFFLGILLAVAVLESTGMLKYLADILNHSIGNVNLIVILIGFLSSIIDNVPLVAAGMGMYDLSVYPQDHYFWSFLAYCAGTGGSCLIIGSAAGVAAMGMEKIDFIWYLKKITWLAVLGYLAGAGIFILQEMI